MRRLRSWTWARRLTATAFLLLIVLGSFDWFSWFKGSTTATSSFGVVPLVDPLAAMEVMLAARTLEPTLIIGGGILVAFAILMGPVFCGWACPLGLILDLADGLSLRVRERLLRRSRSGRRLAIPRKSKYVLLGAALGFAIVAGLPAFQIVSPINAISWFAVGITGGIDQAPTEGSLWPVVSSVAIAMSPGLVFITLILLVERFSPRLWCRTLCPLGALYSLLGRAAIWRVRLVSDHISDRPCSQCVYRCPMGIDVVDDYIRPRAAAIDHPDCTRCGACVDVCPRGVLRLGFRSDVASSPSGASCHGCEFADSDGTPPPQCDAVISHRDPHTG